MRWRGWLFLSFALVFLSGCLGQETLHFQGEGENWEVTYVADIVDDDREMRDITIRYIGDDEAPENIYYQIKENYGESSGDRDLDDGVLELSGESCSGCAVVKEDEEIAVTIEWDGESDRFILESEK